MLTTGVVQRHRTGVVIRSLGITAVHPLTEMPQCGEPRDLRDGSDDLGVQEYTASDTRRLQKDDDLGNTPENSDSISYGRSDMTERASTFEVLLEMCTRLRLTRSQLKPFHSGRSESVTVDGRRSNKIDRLSEVMPDHAYRTDSPHKKPTSASCSFDHGRRHMICLKHIEPSPNHFTCKPPVISISLPVMKALASLSR